MTGTVSKLAAPRPAAPPLRPASLRAAAIAFAPSPRRVRVSVAGRARIPSVMCVTPPPFSPLLLFRARALYLISSVELGSRSFASVRVLESMVNSDKSDSRCSFRILPRHVRRFVTCTVAHHPRLAR